MKGCRKAIVFAFVLLGPGVPYVEAAQQEIAGQWPPPYEEPAPRRYTPWAGQSTASPQQRAGQAPSYRGEYGQRTWSNYGRAGDGWQDEFRRPDEPYREPPSQGPKPLPDYARRPGEVRPGWGAPYGGSRAYGSGSGYYGASPYTPLPYGYGYGPGYGTGLGGTSPWWWGW